MLLEIQQTPGFMVTSNKGREKEKGAAEAGDGGETPTRNRGTSLGYQGATQMILVQDSLKYRRIGN